MYVDGLLAENHGAAADRASTRCSRSRPAPPTRRTTQQPYWPTPDRAARPAGTHLVYLDVWEREVTYLEDPDLVEVAVGVDTTARMQTVWQVAPAAEDVGDATCATPDDEIPGWLDADRALGRAGSRRHRSTSRRTTTRASCRRPAATAASRTSSTASRSTTGGTPGTRDVQVVARQRHGRDRRSSRWSSPTGCGSRPLGRDDVLRFSTGDWVEITRRLREFGAGGRRDAQGRRSTMPTRTHHLHAGAAGRAAARERRQTPARATCACAAGTSTGSVSDGAGTQARRPRRAGLDRRDHCPGARGDAGAARERRRRHVLDRPGGSGGFRAGDYWVFAARTADASVELLDAAPPRGIHHHYARLGTVTFPDSQTDCRQLWPPLGGGGEEAATAPSA